MISINVSKFVYNIIIATSTCILHSLDGGIARSVYLHEVGTTSISNVDGQKSKYLIS